MLPRLSLAPSSRPRRLPPCAGPTPTYHVVRLSYNDKPTGHAVYCDNEPYLVQGPDAVLSRRKAAAIVELLNTGVGRLGRLRPGLA